jgi:hypothetical protein
VTPAVPGLRNNLINIGPGSPAYDVAARRVVELAGKHVAYDDARLLLQLGQFPIVPGDTFFLYYSVYPVLAPENPDKLLNTVLEHYRKHVETEEYRRARILTELDDQLSTVYAVSFFKVLADALIRELRRNGDLYNRLMSALLRLRDHRQQDAGQGQPVQAGGACPIAGQPESQGTPSPQAQPPPQAEELQKTAQELLAQALTDDALRSLLHPQRRA